MKFEIDTSQYGVETLEMIASDTKDEKVLAELAKSDNGSVISAVIANVFTTKETRDEIYKRCNHLEWAVKELIEYPLSTETIHDIVENLCPENVDFWQVAKQQNISTDDLKLLFDIVTTSAIPWNKGYVKATLNLIVESAKVDEELLQKLVEYSQDVAVVVAKKYWKFIKVDLTKGQTE